MLLADDDDELLEDLLESMVTATFDVQSDESERERELFPMISKRCCYGL